MEVEAEDNIDGSVGLDVGNNGLNLSVFDSEFNVNNFEAKTKKTKKRRGLLIKISSSRNEEYVTPRRNSCSSFFEEVSSVPDDVDLSVSSQDYIGVGVGLELFEEELNPALKTSVNQCPDNRNTEMIGKSSRRRDSKSSIKEEIANEIDFGFSDVDIPLDYVDDIDSDVLSTPDWRNETLNLEGSCEQSEKSPPLKAEYWKDPAVLSLPKIQPNIPTMTQQNYDVWSRQESKRSGTRRNLHLPPLNNKKYGLTKHQSKFGDGYS